MPSVRLDPERPPPAHYYAGNLLALIQTVLERYGDILTDDEEEFGRRVIALSVQAQRLLARLLGRTAARGDRAIREDSLGYAEVADVSGALAELAGCGLVERCPAMPPEAVVGLLTRPEMRLVFWEVETRGRDTKADHLHRILGANPSCFCHWRVRRFVGWVRLTRTETLDLYRLLFFGDRQQDLTTFVLRDLGVHRYEPVDLSRETRQFPDRDTLNRFLDLAAARDEAAALFPTRRADGDVDSVDPVARQRAVADLLNRLWMPLDNRMLERRRCRTLNRLGRSLEREGDFDAALACYARSSLAPARERRIRILRRLADESGVEELRSAIVSSPWTTLEKDFAVRFARSFRRRAAPVVEVTLTGSAARIEAHALEHLTANGGMGWHLENHLPMAVFALAYWSWLFAPAR